MSSADVKYSIFEICRQSLKNQKAVIRVDNENLNPRLIVAPDIVGLIARLQGDINSLDYLKPEATFNGEELYVFEDGPGSVSYWFVNLERHEMYQIKIEICDVLNNPPINGQ